MVFQSILVFRFKEQLVLDAFFLIDSETKSFSIFFKSHCLLPGVPKCLLAHEKLFNFVSHIVQDVRLNIRIVVDHGEYRLLLFLVCLRRQSDHRGHARQETLELIELNVVVLKDLVKVFELNWSVTKLLQRQHKDLAKIFDLRPFHLRLEVSEYIENKLTNYIFLAFGANNLHKPTHEFEAALSCSANCSICQVLQPQRVVFYFPKHFVENLVHISRTA